MRFTFDQIWIEKSVAYAPLTCSVIENRPAIPYQIISSDEIDSLVEDVTLTQGKRILLIIHQKGGWVKPCPATNSPYLCCRYTIINHASQCPMDCSYCILQDYLERPLMTLFANQEEAFKDIDALLAEQPKRFFRFGTGELTDSLALDPFTELSRDFIQFFSERKNCLLELKTKTDQVENVLKESAKNVVVSWSVNPKLIVAREEKSSSSLKNRLKAARQCQEKGFLVGFHFDPILHVKNWENLYQDTVDQIFSEIDPSRIAWISLGALRYPANLKNVIKKRFPLSKIVFEEMIRGMDGKMRYPRPLRTEMFQKVYQRIRKHSKDVFVYFCMEPSWVWEKVMGQAPESNADLDFQFAESIHARFPELDMEKPARKVYQEIKDSQSIKI